ncbi:MAG: hypothetical protein ABIN94_03050 [Ferruginibacter sp.]
MRAKTASTVSIAPKMVAVVVFVNKKQSSLLLLLLRDSAVS